MPRRAQRQLSQRDREILKDVILTYILSAEPVSSRSVAKHERHGLSAATIRNVMADLEELGYLTQPHSSAGRVPTESAYHLFIDSLMQVQALSPKERRYISENLKAPTRDPEQLMTVVSHLLSELSNQVGIVMTPVLSETSLKSVEFVPLSGNKLLCILVSESGFVDSKVVETGEPIPRDVLVRISNYMSEKFAGLTLRESRDRLLSMMSEERAQVDRLLALTIELARKGMVGGDDPDVLVDGTAVVLAHPEMADVERVRRLFETFADKARLVQILNRCMQGQGVRVIIGGDSDLTSELGFSLVTASYGIGDRPLGTVGIFGPSRMEYQRVIPLVDYLGESLSRALAETFAS